MAGSTGAVIRLRPRFLATHGSGAVVLIPYRSVAGLFNSTLANSVEKKNWRPEANVKFVDENGCITPPWYRFLRDLSNRKLGGAIFPSVPDLAGLFLQVNGNSSSISQIQVAQDQQANANAQTLASILEVVQTAALAGAMQIPPVQLARAETTAPPITEAPGAGQGGGGD